MYKVNLLSRKRRVTGYIIGLGVFLIFILFTLNLFFSIKVKEFNKKINFLYSDKISHPNVGVEKKYNSLKKEVEYIDTCLAYLEKSINIIPILKNITNYMPLQVKLNRIKVNHRGEILLEGFSNDSEALSVFLESLKEIDIIKKIEVIHYEVSLNICFTLQIEVRGELD